MYQLVIGKDQPLEDHYPFLQNLPPNPYVYVAAVVLILHTELLAYDNHKYRYDVPIDKSDTAQCKTHLINLSPDI